MESLHSYFYYPRREKINWELNPKGIFTIESLYALLAINIYINIRNMKIWSIKTPMRVKAFLWLLEHYQTLSIKHLRRRGVIMLKQIHITSLPVFMYQPFGKGVRICLLVNGYHTKGFRISSTEPQPSISKMW
ncbi:hypothetical protein AMTRI_Chr09g17820 [Amborella trichopoda]